MIASVRNCGDWGLAWQWLQITIFEEGRIYKTISLFNLSYNGMFILSLLKVTLLCSFYVFSVDLDEKEQK